MLLLYLTLADSPKDKDKIERIYYKYRGFMMGSAIKIVKKRELAEDVVHDSVIKIINNIHRIDSIDCPKTKGFIYIIVKNTALTRLTKENKKAALDFDVAEKITVSEKDTFQSIYIKELMQKIAELPDIYRDPLQLSAYYGMSTKEIAKLLEITTGLVNKRIARARALLEKEEKI